MNVSTVQVELARLETCSMAIRRWLAGSSLLLSAGKSEFMFLGTSFQLGAVSAGKPGRCGWLCVAQDAGG